MKRLLAISCLAILAAACGANARPSASVGDLTAVEQELARRGVSVVNGVTGDAGCAGSDLHSNAVRLDVRLGDEPLRSIHLFRWRRPAQFEDAADEFEACADVFAAAGGAVPTILEVPPWRAFGAGWSDTLRTTVEDALRGAGGG